MRGVLVDVDNISLWKKAYQMGGFGVFNPKIDLAN